MSTKELMEVIDFLRRGENKSTLSQLMLPFCSDTSGERSPVALLTGNINLKSNLKKDGKVVSFEEELMKLETEISKLKISNGQIIDLSSEMKKLQIEPDKVDEKEIEIREEWTLEEEILLQTVRKERKIITKPVESIKQGPKQLSNDIDELLRLAEMEEEEEEAKKLSTAPPSKVKEIKKEVIDQNSKISGPSKEISKLKLPKITSTNPSLVGDIVERETDPVSIKHCAVDEVSSRIILNDLKQVEMKSSVSSYDDLEEEEEDVHGSKLKKPSRFSLRKQ